MTDLLKIPLPTPQAPPLAESDDLDDMFDDDGKIKIP
jgi:hypothetical protein